MSVDITQQHAKSILKTTSEIKKSVSSPNLKKPFSLPRYVPPRREVQHRRSRSKIKSRDLRAKGIRTRKRNNIQSKDLTLLKEFNIPHSIIEEAIIEESIIEEAIIEEEEEEGTSKSDSGKNLFEKTKNLIQITSTRLRSMSGVR